MMQRILATLVLAATMAFVTIVCTVAPWSTSPSVPAGRKEVVFWHFWGGADRVVVEGIVERFNSSQDKFFVRAIAMPGSNLDLKLFLAIAGESPPDVVNQDDPILGDWAARSAIVPLAELATKDEVQQLRDWLFPAAVELGSVNEKLFGFCNGLDVRALFYNKTMLEKYGLKPPKTIAELDRLAEQIAPSTGRDVATQFGFLPNPRNLWCWAIVFGGQFFDQTNECLTVDDPKNGQALEWMASYGRRYGTAAVTFRARDQSLPGKTFPLLADRYATIVDGQWRIRDIVLHQQSQRDAGEPVTEFGVSALPHPPGGRSDAGWINGNFFVVPTGAKEKRGAWEFMKFWSGFNGHADSAAAACAAGGWIPVAEEVVSQPAFQEHLQRQPLWDCFIRLAASTHQVPRPNVIGAAMIDREVRQVAERAMYGSSRKSARKLLQESQHRILNRLSAPQNSASAP